MIDIELDTLAAKIVDDMHGPYVIDAKKWCRNLLSEFVEKQQLLVDPLIERIYYLENEIEDLEYEFSYNP